MKSKLSGDVAATAKNKSLQAKLQRKPVPEPKATKGIAEQDSLMQTAMKNRAAVKGTMQTKALEEMEEKMHGIVNSRKQISKPSSGNSTKGPSKGSVQKAISLKR